jgi:serine/threonine protein kinase
MSSPFASVAAKSSLDYLVRYDEYNDFPQTKEIQKVEWPDIIVSKVLGQGGFSKIFRVTVSGEEECEKPGCSSASNGDEEPNEYTYALKCLDSKTLTSEDEFISGVRNLAWEASILSNIHHPNIIQLRGVNSKPPSESYSSISGLGYFILLDVIHETLSQRFHRLRDVSKEERAVAVKQRLQDIAIPIVRAMIYLHLTKKILLRDLNPDNIGFTADGTLKLFDFGLARTLKSKHVPVIVGSYRYTSPEVMMGKDNGFPSNVYSFGVLLWELCTLKRPFDTVMSTKKQKDTFQDKVTRHNYRPGIKNVACKRTKSIIQDCWDANPHARPGFTRVLLRLSDICTEQSSQTLFTSSRLTITRPQRSSRFLRKNKNKGPSQLTMEKMQITPRPQMGKGSVSGNTASNSSYSGDDVLSSTSTTNPAAKRSRCRMLLKIRRNLLGQKHPGSSTTTILLSTEVEIVCQEEEEVSDTHDTRVPAGTV